MDLRNRIAALEAAAEPQEPFADPEYAVALNLALLEQRLIPLPPLDGVDVEATARHWARGTERQSHEFVMAGDGRIVTAAELMQ